MIPKRTAWSWAWLAWLVAFLAVEVPAALRKGRLDTFSENVWEWFGTKAKKGILAVFLLTLAAHLVTERPGAWGIIVTGLPIVVIVLIQFFKRGKP